MYKATQTRIQTYLNDVAGVRIVCAFIDDIGWLLIFNTLIAGLITSFISSGRTDPPGSSFIGNKMDRKRNWFSGRIGGS